MAKLINKQVIEDFSAVSGLSMDDIAKLADSKSGAFEVLKVLQEQGKSDITFKVSPELTGVVLVTITNTGVLSAAQLANIIGAL